MSRAAARTELRSSLTAARIVGEAGVGKTRLLREFLEPSPQRGRPRGRDGARPVVGRGRLLRRAQRHRSRSPSSRPRWRHERDWSGASAEARRGLIEIFGSVDALATTLLPSERRYTVAEALRWALTRAAARAGKAGASFSPSTTSTRRRREPQRLRRCARGAPARPGSHRRGARARLRSGLGEVRFGPSPACRAARRPSSVRPSAWARAPLRCFPAPTARRLRCCRSTSTSSFASPRGRQRSPGAPGRPRALRIERLRARYAVACCRRSRCWETTSS